jgi:SP family xylose:H+ symportor-like MFS transporter
MDTSRNHEETLVTPTNFLLPCLVATLGGLLFGYDTAVISGGIGFLKQFFSLNATQEGWAASSALLGCVLGVCVTGWFSDKFGRKTTLIVAAILFLVSAIGSAIPRSLTEFVLYRALGGVGVGIASMVSPMYIAEIAPAHLRGRLVSVNQIAIASGMLMAYFANTFIAVGKTEAWNVAHGWRWMFGAEAFPCVLFLVLLFFVPESPRWLQGLHKDEHSTWKTVLSPKMRRLLVIGVILAVIQQVTGINVILYYAPKIFQSLGVKGDVSLINTTIIGGSMVFFTLVAVAWVDKWGRRPLLLWASAGMAFSLFAFSYVAYMQMEGVIGLVLIILYIASFSIAMGPVVWVVLSEMFPNNIRGRAMSVATFALWISNYLVSQTFPMLNDNAFLVKTFHYAFPFWVYGGLCIFSIFFVWKYIPETKGKTLEEIEREVLKF